MAITGRGDLLPFRKVGDATSADQPAGDVSGGSWRAAWGGPMAAARRAVLPARIVPISFLGSTQLHFRTPLFVTLEESPIGLFLAGSYDLDLVGEGDSEFAALEDLREQVLELFIALREMKEQLPQHLQAKLAFLESLTV